MREGGRESYIVILVCPLLTVLVFMNNSRDNEFPTTKAIDTLLIN